MAENLSLVAQLIIDRTKALVAIQEQHKPVLTRFGSTVCPICDRLYPCPTRRLADQGLGDNLARTTKNGDAS